MQQKGATDGQRKATRQIDPCNKRNSLSKGEDGHKSDSSKLD